VHDVLLPTLAVVVTWLCAGALLAGCGHLVRRAVAGPAAFGAVDLWIGLAALLAYLQLWSLATGIGAFAWLAPALAGAAGLAVALSHRRLSRHVALASAGAVGLAALGTLWLANRALGPAQDYDLGLYHLGAIRYALSYGTVPGLGNLQTRLGASDGQFLLVAFLHHGPWAGAAPHLVNGLLVSLLFVEIATRFVSGRRGSFTRRLALLLAPAAIAVVGVGPAYRLASPNLDLAAFVLVAVGALYLAELVEDGARRAPALASLAAFAAAAVTRPLYWLPVLLAAAVVVFALRSLRAAAAVLALPALLLLGWAARQSVLSGYPFFPTTIAALPADWRVPAAVVHSQTRIDDAWARWPGHGPVEVNASWHWLSVWFHRRVRDFDVIAPLGLLAALVPGVLAGGRARAAPLLAVAVPSLVFLAVWFAVAPDPRFALAPLWLLPAAVAAWALPAGRLSPSAWAAAGAAAGGLIALALTHLEWLFLAALDGWALVAVGCLLLGSRRARRSAAHAALLSLALVPIGFVADRGAFGIVSADGSGPLRTPPLPVPTVVDFTTSSGLHLSRPAAGDQCWAVVLCTPQRPADLRARGRGIGDGFAS
jgi:hypothetical protein